MNDTEEKLIRLEERTDQNSKDIIEIKREITNMGQKQVKTDIEMTEIKSDVKSILRSVDQLNNNWTDFDKLQKSNANKIKMEVTLFVILLILGFVFTKLNLR